MKKRNRLLIWFVLVAVLFIGFMHPRASQRVDAASTVYTSVSAAGAALRNAMAQRKTSFSLTVRVNGSYSFSNLSSGMVTVCKQVYEEALRHTGAGNAGDYLLWTVSGSSRQPDLSDFDTGYIEVDCYYTISYRDDAGKEGQVTAAVNSALSSLGVSSKSEYDKIKAIYDYIADKVYYDYDEASSPTLRNPTSYTAYAAMINNKSVCQGYALLFYRMCNQAGISCRIVTGTAMGSNGTENHAWNIVRLGGKYYNVDVTWDSTMKHANRPYEYFLKCDAGLKDHTKDPAYKTAPFTTSYPMSATNYGASGSGSASSSGGSSGGGSGKKFKVTINNGSGSGSYASGATVTIKANAGGTGQKFAKWSGTATFTSGNSTSATAKIKVTKDVTLTATYTYATASVKAGTYRLNSKKQAGKFMSIKGNSKKNNANVVLGKKTAKTAKFKITKSGDYYYIMNTSTKKYVNIKGSKAVQGPKGSTSKWRIVSSSGGVYRLINQNGKTITLTNTVSVGADKNSAQQQVKLTK